MRVFLLNAHQAAAGRLHAMGSWEVMKVGADPARALNAQLAELNDPFFVILRATDRMGEGLLDLLSAWISQANHEIAGLALLPLLGNGEPLPVIWRTSTARQIGFSTPPTLPWPELVLIDAYERMGGEAAWSTCPTDQLQPCRLMHAGAQQVMLDRLRPMLRLPSPPGGEMTAPLVSIVLCTYNDSDYLPLALRSIAAQDETRWELIVVDDGSNDAPAALTPYLGDSRVRLIRHERNKGKSAALNSALPCVRAPWLLELDADDWLAIDAVSGLLQHAEAASEETALIYGAYEEWRELVSGALRYAGSRSPSPAPTQLLRSGYPVAPRLYSTKWLRHIGGWPTDDPDGGRLFEDFRMLLLLNTRYRFVNSGLTCYHRRVRRTSISARQSSRFAAWSAWMASTGHYDGSSRK